MGKYIRLLIVVIVLVGLVLLLRQCSSPDAADSSTPTAVNATLDKLGLPTSSNGTAPKAPTSTGQ